MGTKSTNEPWNEWHGMHEGDMVAELVERDVYQFGVTPEQARAYWDSIDEPERIRFSWWLEIGRHNNAL